MTEGVIQSDAARGDFRVARLAIDAAFLAYATLFLFLAPLGNWYDEVLGIPMWEHSDPGGPYVLSALSFFDVSRPLPFIGHPGLTLQFPIALLAWLGYGLARLTGQTAGYFEYWAHHARGLFIAAGLIAALAHVLSFHVLYHFARRLTSDKTVAFLSVLIYATAFPTLYYTTRISVEPLLVTFVLATFLLIWRIPEAAGKGNRPRAHRLAAFAALMAILAFYTKVHLAALLPPIAAAQLLFQSGDNPASLSARLRQRLPFLATFCAACLLFLILIGLRVDWNAFLGAWAQYVPFLPKSEEMIKYLQAAATQPRGTPAWKRALGNVLSYQPGPRAHSLFTYSEGLFVLLALAGTTVFLLRRRDRRSMLLWPLTYLVLLLPACAFNGMWHYLFLHLAIGSVMAALGALWVLERIPRVAEINRATVAARAILLLHLPGVLFSTSGKLHDARTYRERIAPFYHALALREGNEKVAVLWQYPALWLLHGGHPKWVANAKEFHQAFESRFVILPWDEAETAEWQPKHDGPVVDMRTGIPVVINEKGEEARSVAPRKRGR